MRHKRKTLRLKSGQDANEMLMRQLVKNFIEKGKIITTHKRAKALKSEVDYLMSVTKRNSEAARNILKSKLADRKIINLLVKEISPILKDQSGGYLKLIKLNQRYSDGALMVKLEWSKPVVINKDEKARELKKDEKPKNAKIKTQSKN